MKPSTLTCLALFSALLLSFNSVSAKSDRSPNVVVVLVDDLGAMDIAAYGSSFYETPNIDALAERGVLFTAGYAGHPVCSPTRAAIMTGKNPARSEVNITDWIPGVMPKNRKLLGPAINNDLPLQEVTIAEALKEEGYATWFLGKWHLGETEEFWPEFQGFDVNIGGYSSGGPRGGYYAPWKNPRLPEVPEGTYLPDYLTDEAIRLIEARDEGKPFLLYLSFYTVHTPIQASKRHLKQYEQKLQTLPPQEGETYVQRKYERSRARQDNPAYASMVHAMDENVGRLLEALEAEGIDDNTLILFTGDNGGLTGGTTRVGPTSALPLRAGKGYTYEGGIRVPYILRAPCGVGAGSVLSEPVIVTDIFATILDFCDLPLQPELHTDSVSLKPLVASAVDSLERKSPLVWHYPQYHGTGFAPGSAIRVGDWKLVESYEYETIELYNLKDDPSELNDLAAARPEIAADLQQQMHAYFAEVGASMPVANPNYDPDWEAKQRKRQEERKRKQKKQQ
jgi:arylsulfatase A-like enzyme